jgi:hypothetical protein
VQPILQSKGNKYYIFWLCVCSPCHPAYHAQALYCHLKPIRLYCIFPHYLKKAQFSQKKSYWTQNVSTLQQFLSETFIIIRRTKREMIIMYIGLRVQRPFFLSDFNEPCIFAIEFRKMHNYKFHENPSTRSPVVTCGRKDRRTDMTKRIVAFRNFANASKIVYKLDRRFSTRTHSFVIKMAGGCIWEFLYQSYQVPSSEETWTVE